MVRVVEGSGDVNLLAGLINGRDGTLSYNDFDAKRREFLSHESTKDEMGQANLRYYVSKKARTKYSDCYSTAYVNRCIQR
jgi:hypothetical protein